MAPPSDIYEINVDTTIHSTSSMVGFGIVVRDNQGLFMAGKSQSRSDCLDPFCAELLVAREGFLFAWSLVFEELF